MLSQLICQIWIPSAWVYVRVLNREGRFLMLSILYIPINLYLLLLLSVILHKDVMSVFVMNKN